MGKLKESKEKQDDTYDKNRKKDKNYFLIGVAEDLIKELGVVNFNGAVYVKDENGNYVSGNGNIMDVLSKIVSLTYKQYQELLYQFSIKAPKKDSDVCFALKNGSLKKNENGLYEFVSDKSFFCPFYLDVIYDEEANDEYVNKFLDDISSHNEEKKNALVELTGSIFLVEHPVSKIFYLYGPSGSNGKSTFTAMLCNFLGPALTSNVDIGGLQDDTNLSNLVGKLLNVSDDADFSILKYNKTSRMKSIATHETLSFRPIYSYPITAKFFCLLLVSCNNLPIFDDKSGGLIRRLVILDFSMKVEKKDRIPNLVDLLSTPSAKSTLLNIAIKGMNQIIKNNYELTESDIINRTMEEYYIETDNVRKFLKEKDIENKYVSTVYDQYERFCKEDISEQAVPKNVFGSRLKLYGYVSKVKQVKEPGKKTSKRVYVKDNSKKYVEL